MRVIEVDNVSKRFYLRFSREFLATGLIGSVFRRKRREEFWALRNVSFHVERGQSVAVIGPNGSGKTTLLSVISGVTEATVGSVSTAGRISALLQLGAGFHADLTGRENVYINAGVLGFRRREIDRLYPSIADFSELGSFMEAPIRKYSSGMLGRLGFSIAIHMKPDIIIVDEVLSVGDQHFQKKCSEKILEFVNQGVTILFVSHSAATVRSLCSKAVYLEQGNLMAFGDVEEVLAAYNARTDRGPTIGTGAQSGPAARPKPAPTAPPAAAAASNLSAAGTSASKGPGEGGTSSPSRLRPIRHAPAGRLGTGGDGVPADTCFYRNAAQLAALFDYVFPMVQNDRTVRVRCWGCSIGAEPYTLAIEHHRRKIAEYRLAVEGMDPEPELIQAAIGAEYNELELFCNGFGFLSRDLLNTYFCKNRDNNYVLRDDIRTAVMFGTGNLLSPACRALPRVNVALAQNLFAQFKPDEAAKAIGNLVAQTTGGGVVCLGGANADALVEAVRQYNLEPIPYHLEEIHDGWRLQRSRPDAPWGLGPVDRSKSDWEIRYCSLFRTPAEA